MQGSSDPVRQAGWLAIPLLLILSGCEGPPQTQRTAQSPTGAVASTNAALLNPASLTGTVVYSTDIAGRR